MLELKQEGKSVKEIGRIFDVSPRTVQRWLKAVEPASPSVVARSVSDEAISGRGIARPDRSGRAMTSKAEYKPSSAVSRNK
jgi:transposase-like protein